MNMKCRCVLLNLNVAIYLECILSPEKSYSVCLNFVCRASVKLLTVRYVQQVSQYIHFYQKCSCDIWI